MARLFIAVRPPAEVLAAIAALPRPAEPGVRWVIPEQWHITVRFFGEADLDAVTGAFLALDPPAATVDLGPRVSRLGRNVVCLPAAGLEALAAEVARATAAYGEPPDPRPFRGHLTLARLRHRAACGLAGAAFHATFAVRELTLLHSTLGAHGADHRVVATVAGGVGGGPGLSS